MQSLLIFISTIITLYIWIIIAGAILSWLIAFNVVNMQNRIVFSLSDFIHRLTEPALAPIRRFLPNLGGIDISPIILILLLILAKNLLFEFFGVTGVLR